LKRVFVDSSGIFAHIVSEDASHHPAEAAFTRARDEGWRLVTTNAVLYEVHALILNRVRDGRRIALRFLDAVEAGFREVIRVTISDERRAMELLRMRGDQNFSMCDALSFVVMGRLRIREAIAYDKHFTAYGRILVL